MEFYRYEWIGLESARDSLPIIKLKLRIFKLLRETEKGYWIDLEYKDRWISKTSTKRYAYPTKKEALNNFIIRTKRRLQFVEATIHGCKQSLRLADIELNKI